MSSPILITGLPRSGTSITAGLVHMSGVYGGEMVEGNSNNEKGFFESAPVRDLIIKPYLASINADPLGQNPLPTVTPKPPLRDLKVKVEEVLQVAKGERYFLKEPKILLMWKSFHQAFPKAKWVIVRRDLDQILSSVVRTPFMRAYSTKEEWVPWANYHLNRIKELKAAVDYFEFWPQRALTRDYSHMADLETFLGIEIPYRESREFLDPKLWNK